LLVNAGTRARRQAAQLGIPHAPHWQ
jgi:hypothetical protein